MREARHASAVLLAFFCAAAACLVALSCSGGAGSVDNGSGTGVGNGVVVGTVIYSDSTPVMGATVRLRPQSFLADTSGAIAADMEGSIANVTTDSAGNFSIGSLDTGVAFSIEVVDKDNESLATLFRAAAARDTADLQTHVVQPVLKISGAITLSGLPANAYVFVYGLEKVSRTDSQGSFVINDLPVGHCEHGECEYMLRVYAPTAVGGVKAIDYELEVTAGQDSVPVIELEIEGRD